MSSLKQAREDELRKLALEKACMWSGGSMTSFGGGPAPAKDVVGRAEAYLAFLKGGEK